MKQVIVIGGGASGLMAAVTAASKGAAVTLLEGMEKPGKKILVTGNGRCNLTNTDETRKDRYRGSSPEFIETVLGQFPVSKTMEYFEQLGLLLKNRNGYVYPYVNQASAVQELLLMEAARLHVKVKCNEKVKHLEKTENGWKVQTETWCYSCHRVILAAGSRALPGTGSDGSGYVLAKSLGHRIITPMEALVPLKVRENWVRKLAGIRMPARITLKVFPDGKIRDHSPLKWYQEDGELQWTEYGISGIVVFQLSRYAVRALAEKKNVTAELDLMPEYEEEQLFLHMKNRMRYERAEEWLTGLLPKKMISVILELCGLRASKKVSDLTESEIRSVVDQCKQLTLHITGSRSFDAAQVCSGGVDTDQVDPVTLESKCNPGLYFAGEILDVDGICGGYNLQWAWSSGYAAGLHSAK